MTPAIVGAYRDWQDITVNPGFTVRAGEDYVPRVSMRSGIVFITGQIDFRTGSHSGTIRIAQLPDWAYPPGEVPIRVAGDVSYDAWIDSTGRISMSVPRGVPQYLKINTSYAK